MYKALITDLDGTAIPISSDGSSVDRKTKQAIINASKAGFKITCASGRDWNLAKPAIKNLGFSLPCIIEGGARIIDPIAEKTVWEKYLENGSPMQVLKTFKLISKKRFSRNL